MKDWRCKCIIGPSSEGKMFKRLNDAELDKCPDCGTERNEDNMIDDEEYLASTQESILSERIETACSVKRCFDVVSISCSYGENVHQLFSEAARYLLKNQFGRCSIEDVDYTSDEMGHHLTLIMRLFDYEPKKVERCPKSGKKQEDSRQKL